MKMRAKMNLEAVVPRKWGGVEATFRCVYTNDPADAEGVAFTKATPSGYAYYTIENPDAIALLVIGQEYYVDFTPVPDPAASTPAQAA